MKKFSSITISLFLICCFTLTSFAFSTLDGAIRSEEIENSKVQILSNKNDSGNKVNNIISYYNNSPAESTIYLAFNMDTGSSETNENFRIIICMDSKPKIEISNDGKAAFDPYFFDVKTKLKQYGSTISCENKIIYKFETSNTPQISLTVLDNDGIPSKIFKIDTYCPSLETSHTLEPSSTLETSPLPGNDAANISSSIHKDNKDEKTTSKKAKNKKIKSTKASQDKKSPSIKRKTNTQDAEYISNEFHSDSYESHEFKNTKNTDKKVIHLGEKSSNDNPLVKKYLALGISSGIIVAIVITTMILNIKKANAKEIEKARKEREEKLNNSRGKSNYKK